MNRLKNISLLAILVYFVGFGLVSCSDNTEETTIPRNYFEGVMDGRAFSNNNLRAYKSNEDFFTFTANIGNGISMIAFVNGKAEEEYEATQGSLFEVSELLDQTLSLDTFLIDSIQTILNTGSGMPIGECYSILISENNFYYSNRGSITLTRFDGSINRIYGEIDLELKNILNGTRYIQAFFEDVYYNDCPEIGICLL